MATYIAQTSKVENVKTLTVRLPTSASCESRHLAVRRLNESDSFAGDFSPTCVSVISGRSNQDKP